MAPLPWLVLAKPRKALRCLNIENDAALVQSRIVSHFTPKPTGADIMVQYLYAAVGSNGVTVTLAVGTFGHEQLRRQ